MAAKITKGNEIREMGTLGTCVAKCFSRSCMYPSMESDI